MKHFKNAFTLIELLVVIAIIAILMGILMPALSAVKKKAQGTVCLTRQKTLILAYRMYADDNEDKIVNSDTSLNNNWEGYWVEPPQTEDGSTVGVANMTMEDRKRGIERGVLFPYIKSVDFYRCPGDERRRMPENSGQCAWRSYSIPAGLNSVYAGKNNTASGGLNADYYCYTNFSRIKQPATALCFVEEAEKLEGFNHHSWAMFVLQPRFYDPLSIYHGDSSTLGFVDGHAENRKWRAKETIEIFASGAKNKAVDKNNEDYVYLRSVFPYERLKK